MGNSCGLSDAGQRQEKPSLALPVASSMPLLLSFAMQVQVAGWQGKSSVWEASCLWDHNQLRSSAEGKRERSTATCLSTLGSSFSQYYCLYNFHSSLSSALPREIKPSYHCFINNTLRQWFRGNIPPSPLNHKKREHACD